MYRIDKITGSHAGFNNANSPLPDNFITALESVGDSILWIGTLNGGLVKLQDDAWTVYDTTNSPLYSNRISTLDSDENGVLWVGSGMENYDQLGMIARFDGSNWTVFDELWYPNEIHVEDTNLIWIRRGEEVQTLVKFDGQQIITEYNPWEWTTSCPWCFESFNIDIHGNKWIQSDSLVKFDDTTFTKYSAGIPMSYGGMHIDTDTLWFPMPEGYARFANEEWSFYQKPDTIQGPVEDIEIDSEENKWFSIWEKGFIKRVTQSGRPF